MQCKQLGRSDLQISRIGFGCMSLSPDKEAESIEMIHRAIETGINYFDTAGLYNKGMNEMLVGKALKTKREKIIVASKGGNQWRDDGSGWNWNPRKEYILKAVDESLRRLQMNHIDLYQLHGGTIDDRIDDVIEAFELLQQQGKIRYYGISSIRPNVIGKYAGYCYYHSNNRTNSHSVRFATSGYYFRSSRNEQDGTIDKNRRNSR